MIGFLYFDIHKIWFIRLQQMLHKVITVLLGIKSSVILQHKLLDRLVHCDETLVSEVHFNYGKIERVKFGQLFLLYEIFQFSKQN
jgi:hypothetical protein